jgi:uncharacterized membrane protein
MTATILALKFVHIIGATILFGTGLGIAFFMWMAHRSGDPRIIAGTARVVVIADTVFTATAAIVQPISGALLAWSIGYSLWHPWIALSLALYVFVGVCWLPVVWIQMRLRDLAHAAVRDNTRLPGRYHQLFRLWFMLGWPAFIAVLAIFALMIWRPPLW